MIEPERTEENLRLHFQEESGIIKWRELEHFFAAGRVIEIDKTLDLIDVAIHVTLDDTSRVKEWMDAGLVTRIEDERALDLQQSKVGVTAVISRPWIFIQP